jgi:hypothetical protein
VYEAERYTTWINVSDNLDNLTRALRSMPAPEPRPEFVEQALAKATRQALHDRQSGNGRLRHIATRWETWLGAAMGGAIAAALTIFLLRPVVQSTVPEGDVTLALNETREIQVRIESERPLENATIRIAVTGEIALDGFEDERHIDWRANLDRGTNVLFLPVVARGQSGGRLVAIVEHEGRTRTMAIELRVKDSGLSRS